MRTDEWIILIANTMKKQQQQLLQCTRPIEKEQLGTLFLDRMFVVINGTTVWGILTEIFLKKPAEVETTGQCSSCVSQ